MKAELHNKIEVFYKGKKFVFFNKMFTSVFEQINSVVWQYI